MSELGRECATDRLPVEPGVVVGEAVARMEDARLQDLARARADELPGAELTHPFGPEWDVYKVRDKVFMLLTDVTGEAIVIVKAEPAEGAALRAQYEQITPGYHMNKKHWITLRPSRALPVALVDDLVTESYLLVVEKLPRSRRPVDPATFGQSQP